MEKICKEIIAFRRRKVIVSSNENIDPRNMDQKRNLALVSLVAELKKAGFYLSSECLCRLTLEDMEGIYKNLLPYLYEAFINRSKFKPLYPGFPEQVMSKSEAELITDRDKDRVYSGDLEGFIKDNPWLSTIDRKKIEKDPTKELKPMTNEEFMDIPQQIMGSGNSLTQDTRDELVWFLDNYQDLKLPERIPFKETLCLVVSMRPEYELKEINDVLRYGIYLLGGSPDLKSVPKTIKVSSWSKNREKNPEWRNLKSLPRARRKEICQRLEKIIEAKGIGNCVKDAKANYGHWVLLSERVHPKEFILRFPDTAQFFHVLKSHALSKQYKTFDSEVQGMYDSGKDIDEIAKFISKRPGILVRKLDSLIRRSGGKFDEILDIFFDTKGMKNKTLLELLSYYDTRNSDAPRYVSILGSPKYILEKLDKLPDHIIDAVQDVIVRKVLLNIQERVNSKDLEGKLVYLDPDIKKIPIPKAMRNQSVSIPVGTRYKISEDGIVRFFVHWVQKDKPEDLDLHAFLWKNDRECTNIGWNTSFRKGCYAVHSGDVLNRPGDCAEYVDIDMKEAKKDGVKYIVADIMNYKGRGLYSLPCWIGYMNRDRLEEGDKTWIPEDVELSIPMKCKESSVAAFLIDVDKSELMILDCPMNGIPVLHKNSYSTQTAMIKYFTVTPKYTSYDILKTYYEARGAEVIDKLSEEDENKEDNIVIAEKIEFNDIASDYVKVLSIIGE